MIDIQRLYEYGLELKSANIGINEFKMVDNPDKLIECLKDFTEENNHLLIIVLPSYDSNGSSNFDDLEFNSYVQFLVLEKYDRREFESNLDEMMMFQRTLESLKKLINQIKTDYFNNHYCDFLSTIKASTMTIDPVRHQSDTSGYSLTFTF